MTDGLMEITQFSPPNLALVHDHIDSKGVKQRSYSAALDQVVGHNLDHGHKSSQKMKRRTTKCSWQGKKYLLITLKKSASRHSLSLYGHFTVPPIWAANLNGFSFILEPDHLFFTSPFLSLFLAHQSFLRTCRIGVVKNN